MQAIFQIAWLHRQSGASASSHSFLDTDCMFLDSLRHGNRSYATEVIASPGIIQRSRLPRLLSPGFMHARLLDCQRALRNMHSRLTLTEFSCQSVCLQKELPLNAADFLLQYSYFDPYLYHFVTHPSACSIIVHNIRMSI
jgi:hypothetical protein